ncbi:flagellar biosynthetic protein FliO [Labrenzia sp. CE80]|uniref:flagellar biosynthetic protein FliO n=1 Tax=Labrenzia sp. CE80 TaxID=1788986 RepID=UPI001389982E|nr:flagellar biosynthetic protein FliO [Labrenzia sp. CE80]
MYTWIAETFGVSDGLARGLAFAISLGIVLILIALFVMILKRLTGTRLANGRSRQPRIAVMDATNIDTRRRLLLIRRDNVEHLILVGGPTDLVVEQNIIKTAPLTAGGPRPQASGQVIAPTAAGYTTPATSSDVPLVEQAQPAAPLDVAHAALRASHPERSALAAQTNKAPPAAPTPPVGMTRPESPRAQSAPKATTADKAKRNVLGEAPVNPARSLLKAAAAGKLTAGFGEKKTAPEGEPSQRTAPAMPPRPAPAPLPAARPAPQRAQPQASRTGSSSENSSTGQQTASGLGTPALRAALAPGRPVSPPSSGPAARAKTAIVPPAAPPVEIQSAVESAPAEPTNEAKQAHATPTPPATVEAAIPIKVEPAADTPAEQPLADIAPQNNGQNIKKLSEPETIASANTSTAEEEDKAPASQASNPIEDEMAKLLDEMHGPQKP